MDKYQRLKEILGVLRTFENEPLSKHTYFKIGGPASLFFEAKNLDDFKLALTSAVKLGIPFVVIGGGANILVSDEGFEGLVIKNRVDEVKLVGIKGTFNKEVKGIQSALIHAASGTFMNRLARFTLDQGLEGLEFLLSVPGSVGGGIKINAHYEVEKNEFVGNKLVQATLFDPKDGKIKTVEGAYFEFSYDHSKIQETGEIVLDATFKLDVAPNKEMLWQKSMENVKRRNLEQPIGIACSGCAFRNISRDDAVRLATHNLTTSTGYIIESLGLKGAKSGGAEISTHHANFILNTNNATAKDVLELINLVKDKAQKTYGINLKEEIFYVGKF